MALNIKKITIPNQPGCYIMKNSAGEVIYVGKAKNLGKRVKSYWRPNNPEWKNTELLREIKNIEFLITRNEMEALIMEARLIKQYQPKYNFKLKENQPYMYIKITDEELPRLVSVRKIEGGGKYFGPFTSGKGRKYLLLTTARLFGLRTGKLNSRSSRELYQLLSEIKSRDLENISAKDYQRNVKLAELFLRGKKEILVKELEARMKIASQKQNYELAKLYLDQIRSIKNISEKQLISLPKSYDQDVVNYVLAGERLMVQVFNVNHGVVTSRNEYNLVITPEQNTDEIFSEFIRQYYLTRPIPKEIILPKKIIEQSLTIRYLEELKGEKVIITIPNQGDKSELLFLVKDNILSRITHDPAEELQARLNLPHLPLRIDCFDISNISGVEAVGSCVRFVSGKPNKDLYRKFKIKTVIGPNDYTMMKEVISRRYSHQGWEEPDLIVVDGGKGQLNIASQVLAELKLSFPVISLAKRLEEVFIPGQSKAVIFDRRSNALKLLQQLRDEAHRFAITYHKLLRSKRG